MRRHLPESPRWLIIHGREREAEENIAYIEHEVESSGQTLEPVDESRAIEIRPQPPVNFLHLAKVLFAQYTSRSILSATLMITQSFLYNAIFFTYTLVLTKVYDIPATWAPGVPHRLRGRQPGRAADAGHGCSTRSDGAR